jgi:hypothetical protein
MVGGKQIPPQDSRRGVLVRRRKGIPGKDEASLRPDAMVVSRPQRQGSGDERSDKTVGPPLTPLPARKTRGVLENVLDNADAVIDGTWHAEREGFRTLGRGAEQAPILRSGSE